MIVFCLGTMMVTLFIIMGILLRILEWLENTTVTVKEKP